MTETESRDFGPQPLIEVMRSLGVTSNDLIAACDTQLTYKMVARACKGRKLTLNAQNKILTALRTLRPEAKLTLKEIFNYKNPVEENSLPKDSTDARIPS